MIRYDGSYVIYYVEFKPKDNDATIWWDSASWWDISGSGIISKVPSELRWVNPPGWDGKALDPFESFSSNGDCWQQTGIHGSFDKKYAFDLKNILEQHWYDKYLFRVMQLNITQERIPL